MHIQSINQSIIYLWNINSQDNDTKILVISLCPLLNTINFCTSAQRSKHHACILFSKTNQALPGRTGGMQQANWHRPGTWKIDVAMWQCTQCLVTEERRTADRRSRRQLLDATAKMRRNTSSLCLRKYCTTERLVLCSLYYMYTCHTQPLHIHLTQCKSRLVINCRTCFTHETRLYTVSRKKRPECVFVISPESDEI